MWYVVTGYKTPKGQIIRHLYGKDGTGAPFKSYAGARSKAKRLLKEATKHYSPSEWRYMEANAVKVVTYDEEPK